jgi:diketogulonate reductase-like aldo/keto reductase
MESERASGNNELRGVHEGRDPGVTRREFLGIAVAATCAAGTETFSWAADTQGGVPYRSLGRTGEKVSMVGLGGYHLGNPKDAQDSIRIIRAGIDNGINFLDNCWDYHDGESEVRMGKALRDGYRQRAFLMTKLDGHTKVAAAQQLEESLRRLQTDHIDLVQFHEIIRTDDPDKLFAAGGGMEALMEARKAGKVRYIGFTGHKNPDIHLRMLEVAAAHQFHFDAVQMPLNVMDAHFHSFEKKDRRTHRMPALRHEPPDQRGHHRLRIDGQPGAGFESRENISPDERIGSRRAAGEDGCRGAKRRVRVIQNHESI